DGQIRTGRFFGGAFTGVGVHLVDFRSAYRQTGLPMDFVSTVQLLDPQGTVVRTQDVRVNHPAQIDGLNIFQYGFGWAPQVTVTVLSTCSLDTRFMHEVSSGIVGADSAANLSSGILLGAHHTASNEIAFPALRQYSVFQVSHDAGVPIVLGGAILILVGLLPA